MNKLFFLPLIALLGAQANARTDSIRLGELEGDLPTRVVTAYEGDGDQDRTYEKTCKAFVNLNLTRNSLDYSFSYFQCGGDTFNDPILSFDIRGAEVFDRRTGEKAGFVDEDGSVRVELKSTRQVKVLDRTDNFDPGCRIGGVKERTVNLESVLRYSISRMNGGFAFRREVVKDFISTQWKRSARCPGTKYEVTVKGTQTAVSEGNLLAR